MTDSPTLTATVLPELDAVRLELAGIDNGPVSIMRTDRNGTEPVRQLPGQTASSYQLATVDYEAALAGAVRYDAQVIAAPRTNALANPDFEVDASGYTAVRGTIARSTSSPWEGAALGTYTSSDATTAGGNYVLTQSLSVTPGQAWTGSVSLRASAAAGVSTIRLSAQWYTNGAWVSAAEVATVQSSVPTGTVQRLYWTGTAPAGTTLLRFIITVQPTAGGGIPVGATFDLDAVMAEQTREQRPYVKGTVQGDTYQLTRTVTLTSDAPVVSVPIRPQVRYALDGTDSAMTDYDEGSSSGTIRHDILGATTPVLVLRPLQAREGTFTFRLPTYADAKALRAVLAGADVVLVRQPTYDGLDAYVAITGVSIQPVMDSLPPAWSVAAKYAETDPPAGGLLGAAAWTVGDVAALGVAIGQVPALFATVYALAVGP